MVLRECYWAVLVATVNNVNVVPLVPFIFLSNKTTSVFLFCSSASVLFIYILTGNGDVLSFEEYDKHREETGVAGIMIARYLYCTLYVVLYEFLC